MPTTFNVPETTDQAPPPSMGIQDVLYVIFKHKWMIILCTLLGLGAAATVYMLYPPVYESDAKLLVRYVLDRTVIDPAEGNSNYSRANENALSAEAEILTSYDLAQQVAEAVGVEQLAPESRGAPSGISLAAQTVQKGLWVSPTHGNILLVSYRSGNPALATKVLQELVSRYFVKHLEVHRSADTFRFVTEQADQVHGRLSQTEDELKRAKDKIKVISLPESVNAINGEIGRNEAALEEAETQRAEQAARLQEYERALGKTPEASSPAPAGSATPKATATPKPAEASSADIQEYQALVNRETLARQTEQELLAKYTSANWQVRTIHTQIETLERSRAALAAKFPELAAKVAATTGGAPGVPPGPDLLEARTRLAALDARVASLKGQLQTARARAEELAGAAPQIAQLERLRELEEANYRYYAASLEKARVDEALDPSKIPNISVVQKPTVAMRTTNDLHKILFQLAGGGLALGLGLAFLIEMVFDQTIKRASEFERRLRIPLLLSIPRMPKMRPRPPAPLQVRNTRKEDGDEANGTDGANGVSKAIQPLRRVDAAPWETGHFIRPYAEAIRDRLGLYFELNNLTHKPKLVAITGTGEGEGISTIAGGIAAALSEMGEGKVLLVNMNVGQPEIHSFYNGKPAYALMTALHPACPIAPAAENLYLATTYAPTEEKQVQMGPKRLYELMPSLKASNFDYIIFDMPSLDQSSAILSMAGLMDKVLLVTEAGKAGVNMVRRAYQELTAAQGKVSCVLNKTRNYGPRLSKSDF